MTDPQQISVQEMIDFLDWYISNIVCNQNSGIDRHKLQAIRAHLASAQDASGRLLPELPEGWFIGLIVKNNFGWCVKLINDEGTKEQTCNGSTPREAVLSTISKIQEQR